MPGGSPCRLSPLPWNLPVMYQQLTPTPSHHSAHHTMPEIAITMMEVWMQVLVGEIAKLPGAAGTKLLGRGLVDLIKKKKQWEKRMI